jgi:hypothetical protein
LQALETAPEIGVLPVRLPEDGDKSTRRHHHRASGTGGLGFDRLYPLD